MPYPYDTYNYQYYQPRQQMVQPMQPVQQSVDTLVRVTGMDGAKAYQMPPSSRVALFDGSEPYFYVKETDAAGYPTIHRYSFELCDDAAPVQQGADYVTRAELDDIKKQIAELKGMTSNAKPAVSRSKQPAAADAQ